MALRLVQPTFSSPSTTFVHTNTPPGSTLPRAFFVEFTMDEAPGALGSALINEERMPPGFGGYHHRMIRVNQDMSVTALVSGSGGAQSELAGPIVLGQRHTLGALFTSTTSLTVFLDGVEGPTVTDFAEASGLEDTLFGAGATVIVGTYNKGFKGCMRNAVRWVSTVPDAADFAAMHAGTDPFTVKSAGIVQSPPLDDLDSAVDAYAWNGSAIVQTTDLILNVVESAGGAFETCDDIDNPDPVETGEDECGSEDEADPLQPAIEWPQCGLVPGGISVDIISPTVSPGRSFTGREKIVQPDAGSIRIILSNIPVRTKAEAFRWRQIEQLLKGRSSPILVPVYSWNQSDTAIDATAIGEYGIGEARVALQQDAGEEITAGMPFSFGEWLYFVKRVNVQETGGFTEITISPPLRAAVSDDDAANFTAPVCRCRLSADDQMNLDLGLLRFGNRTVEFREDV